MNHKHQHHTGRQRPRVANACRRPAAGTSRRGSTLLVVIALMGMLSLLGLMFFSFASQEQESSKNFLEAAKAIHNPELDADVYFNWGLRQLIRGPEPTETQSVFYGGHMSLLANAYGRDAHPHTGKGLTLRDDRVTDTTGAGYGLTAFADLDGDGSFNAADFVDWDQDGIADHLEINRSAPANVYIPGGGDPNVAFIHESGRFPEPDVDYTYPDINNTYLAYVSHVWVTERDLDGSDPVVPDPNEDFNGNGRFDTEDTNLNGMLDPGEDVNGDGSISPLAYQIRIVKPSFWRPELLSRLETSAGAIADEDANHDGYWDPLTEDANGNGVYDTTDFNGNQARVPGIDDVSRLDPTWYWQEWSKSLVLRAHPFHFYIEPPQPQLPGFPPPPPPAPPTMLRYLTDANPADAALIAGLPGNSKGFPFAGPRDVSSGDTLPLREGVWRGWMQAPDPSSGISQYEFDADADNDGIKEAILLDLGFPAQYRPSDGALYVPIYAMTVYDADGLINLNATGNLAGDTSPPAPTGVFGNGLGTIPVPTVDDVPAISISESLSALSTFEINPLWGLDGIPDDTASNPNSQGTIDVTAAELGYQQYYGRLPLGNGDVANRWEHANMELFWLKKGRIEYDASGNTEIHEGIYGEANLVEWMRMNAASLGVTPIAMNSPAAVLPDGTLGINLFPYPGYFNRDDNRNANYGGRTNDAQGLTLAFGHPLSVSGRGSITTPTDPKALNLFSPTGTPMSWLQYDNFDVAGVPEWAQPAAIGGQLMTGTRFGQLFQHPGADGNYNTGDEFYVDDPTELLLEPRQLQRPADEALSVADAAYLQLAKSDIDAIGVHSRVRDLMPGQIDANDTSVDANARRHRFTTSSWDRKQYGYPLQMDVGPDGRPGDAGQDDNGNGKVDDFGELGLGDDNDLRAWEFNVDVDQDGLPEFPPEYAGAPASAQWSALYALTQRNQAGGYQQGILPEIPQDPFRAEVRRLLEIELGNRNDLKLQFPLSLNRLLDVERVANTGGHSLYSPLEFRPLTPHAMTRRLPAGNSVPTITPGEFLPPISSTAPEVREFWARYDRQRLARDIYVTLYTLCGGDVQTKFGLPVTATPLNTSAYYTTAEMEEMAQFAVNLVDQLDPDNIITVFEYDTDLTDGWDLDDQAVTVETTTQRSVAVGTEAQELTFSETLWVFQEELANDNDHTPFDETNPPAGTSGSGTPGFHFAQVELRNVSPRTVNLAHASASTSATTGVWRLRWVDSADESSVNPVSETPNLPSGNGIVFKSNAGSLNAGGLFTIATSNNTGPDSSDLYVDLDDNTAEFELVAPRFGTSNTTVMGNNPTSVPPNTNLDLVNTTGSNQQKFELINGVNGDLLSADYEPSIDNPVLILERRADPTQPELSIAHNPWVVVDWTRLEKKPFVPTSAATSGSPDFSDTSNRLQNLQSSQRIQPLNADDPEPTPGGSDPLRQNSLMGNNSNSPATFDLLQLHFDRDLASAVELLDLTLFGPMQTTRSVLEANSFSAEDIILDPNPQGAGGGGPPGGGPPGGGPPGGGPPGGGPPGGIPPGLAKQQNRYGNHWHRFSSFFEVPSRPHTQTGKDFETTRVPGRINLNTMREGEVLASVLDSPLVHQDVNSINGGLWSRIDGAGTVPVDYWRDLLRSRDGDHPDYAVDLDGSGTLEPIERTGLTLPGTPFSKPFRSIARAGDVAVDDPVQDSIYRDHPDADSTDPTGGGLFEVNATGNDHVLKHQLLTKIANNTTTRSNVFFVFIHVQFHEAYEDPTTGAIRVAGRIDLNEDSVRDDGHRGFFIIDRSAAEEAYDTQTGTFDWRQLVKHRLTIN